MREPDTNLRTEWHRRAGSTPAGRLSAQARRRSGKRGEPVTTGMLGTADPAHARAAEWRTMADRRTKRSGRYYGRRTGYGGAGRRATQGRHAPQLEGPKRKRGWEVRPQEEYKPKWAWRASRAGEGFQQGEHTPQLEGPKRKRGWEIRPQEAKRSGRGERAGLARRSRKVGERAGGRQASGEGGTGRSGARAGEGLGGFPRTLP